MSREQSLLTALTRLLGVFYGLRAMEFSASSLFYMFTIRETVPEAMAGFPDPTLVALIYTIVYVGLAAGVYFLAPSIARICLPETRSEEDPESIIHWNDTMVFCSGLFLFGWGLIRLVDLILGGLQLIPCLITLLVLSAGWMLMAKFHRVTVWMARKKQAGQEPH